MNRDQNVPNLEHLTENKPMHMTIVVHPKMIVSRPVEQNIVSFCCSAMNHLSYALAEESLNLNDPIIPI